MTLAPEAWQAMFMRVRDYYRYSSARLSFEDAEDLAQTVMLRLLEKSMRADLVDPEALLVCVAKRQFSTMRRLRVCQRRDARLTTYLEDVRIDLHTHIESPYHYAERRERQALERRTLRERYKGLGLAERTCLRLNYGEGFTLREIAAFVGSDRTCLKTYTKRAVQRLRGELPPAAPCFRLGSIAKWQHAAARKLDGRPKRSGWTGTRLGRPRKQRGVLKDEGTERP